MSGTVIRVQNLSKLYRLGELHKQTNSFRDRVTQAFSQLAQRAKRKANSAMLPPPCTTACPVERKAIPSGPLSSDDSIWALKDVSLEIKSGEIVGIIGRNGAGKSTLLKILSRITLPTCGEVTINGRVGSLLEVGTGFHPELTGRENIYLNGAILGMKKAEIKRKFEEIVNFAGIEKFIDTPVKRYSSGMYVRLAFAVAAHLEPEILLIDEVLAVGDFEFQKKCLGKMEDVSKEGRTVLFVSHNMSAINNICSKGILLKNGQIIFQNTAKKTVEEYLKINEQDARSSKIEYSTNRTGNKKVQFADFYLMNSNGEVIQTDLTGEDLTLVFKMKVNDPAAKKIDLGFSLHSVFGDTLSVLYSSYQNVYYKNLSKGYKEIKCTIKEFPFLGRLQVKGRILVNGVESDWPREAIGFIDTEMGDFYRTGNTGLKGNIPFLVKGTWE